MNYFAKFFKPKSEICQDGVLEMDVDGVNFTCAPVEVSIRRPYSYIIIFFVCRPVDFPAVPPPVDVGKQKKQSIRFIITHSKGGVIV